MAPELKAAERVRVPRRLNMAKWEAATRTAPPLAGASEATTNVATVTRNVEPNATERARARRRSKMAEWGAATRRDASETAEGRSEGAQGDVRWEDTRKGSTAIGGCERNDHERRDREARRPSVH